MTNKNCSCNLSKLHDGRIHVFSNGDLMDVVELARGTNWDGTPYIIYCYEVVGAVSEIALDAEDVRLPDPLHHSSDECMQPGPQRTSSKSLRDLLDLLERLRGQLRRKEQPRP
jgi:hypothetical protein